MKTGWNYPSNVLTQFLASVKTYTDNYNAGNLPDFSNQTAYDSYLSQLSTDLVAWVDPQKSSIAPQFAPYIPAIPTPISTTWTNIANDSNDHDGLDDISAVDIKQEGSILSIKVAFLGDDTYNNRDYPIHIGIFKDAEDSLTEESSLDGEALQLNIDDNTGAEASYYLVGAAASPVEFTWLDKDDPITVSIDLSGASFPVDFSLDGWSMWVRTTDTAGNVRDRVSVRKLQFVQ